MTTPSSKAKGPAPASARSNDDTTSQTDASASAAGTVSEKRSSKQTPKFQKLERSADAIKARLAEAKKLKQLSARNVVIPEIDEMDPSEIEALREQFEILDTDGTGEISREEFLSMCEKLHLPQEQAIELLNTIDDNEDAAVTFEEFIAHDVLDTLIDSIDRKERDHSNETIEKEKQTHVNIGRILEICRAKIENSRLAYQFVRQFLFLAIYAYVVIDQKSPKQSMGMRAALRKHFLRSKFRKPTSYQLMEWSDVATIEDLWDFQQIHFAGRFHQEKYYNGEFFNREDRGSLLQHIKLTGGFRLVQRRSKNGTCDSYPEYAVFSDDCYAETFADGMLGSAYDTAPIIGKKSGTKYEHQAYSYFDQGFFENFDLNRTATNIHLQRLRDDAWIDKGTRYVKIDFVAYLSTSGLFTVMEFIVDMRTSGTMTPRLAVMTRRYDYYQSNYDFFRLALEILLVIWFTAHVFQCGQRMFAEAKQKHRTFAYFFSMWNLVDVVNVLLFGIGLAAWLYIVTDPALKNLEITETRVTFNGLPINFFNTNAAVEVYYAVQGLNMLVGMVRLMRFLRMNTYTGQLTDALEFMKTGLTQYLFVLIIVIVFFTFLGMILFGSQLKGFSEPVLAIDSVMGLAVGYGDIWDLFESSGWASGLIFWIPFITIMIFFVLPLTIAIIMDGYVEMQNVYEMAAKSNLRSVFELQLPTQFYRGITRAFQLFVWKKEEHSRLRFPSKEDTVILFSEYIKDYCTEGTTAVPFTELLKNFRARDMKEDYLRALVQKYDAFEPDPSWNYLVGGTTTEIEKKKASMEKENNSPHVLGQLLEDLESRVDQIILDQGYALKKLDFLCQIFPAQNVQNVGLNPTKTQAIVQADAGNPF